MPSRKLHFREFLGCKAARTSGAYAFRAVLIFAYSVLFTTAALAQNTPLLSGGMGFFTSTNRGNTSYIPTLNPLLVAPIGDHLQVESEATLLDIAFPTGKGYDTFHFTALSYLQADYFANPHVTVVGGLFLLPFGTFNERLSPIWVNNFTTGPLISSIGTGTGAGLGGMLRGNAYSDGKVSVDYAVYYSARSGNEQFSAQRSTGFRVDTYLPQSRLEVGMSFNRLLQGTNANAVGFHVWWLPPRSSFQLRSEYAHTAHAYGYWVETAYRLSRFGGRESALGRLEPLFRMQQTFRNAPDATDGLPGRNTQQADFGLDYNLPHDVRIKTSYSRQFSSSGNRNIWQTGIVYRFLFPAWKGRS